MFDAYVKFLGVSTGESARGKFYNFSFMVDGDTMQIRCSEEVAMKASKLNFGDEVSIKLELKNYRGDWYPRISDIEV